MALNSSKVPFCGLISGTSKSLKLTFPARFGESLPSDTSRYTPGEENQV